jgi:hypothetical protein
MNPMSRDAVKGAWRTTRPLTYRMRTLPGFLIIGTRKGGTSPLLNDLLAHPDTARHTRREVRSFDRWYAQYNFFGTCDGFPDELAGPLRDSYAPCNQRLYEHPGRDLGWD